MALARDEQKLSRKQLQYVLRTPDKATLLFGAVDEDGNPATFIAPTLVHLEGLEGDVLEMEGVLHYDAMTWIGVAEWAITGGEGKFAGAEGSVSLREYAGFTIQGGTTYGIGAGTITRPTEKFKADGRVVY